MIWKMKKLFHHCLSSTKIKPKLLLALGWRSTTLCIQKNNLMSNETILITGANGQLGSELTQALRERYGAAQVIATDIRESDESQDGPFEQLDVLDGNRLVDLVHRYKVTQIYHLAAILSAKGEERPQFTWQVNMEGLFNVLNVARDEKLDKVYYPSSIAIFGTKTPRENTPQDSIFNPSTVYGISKLAGEHWCSYYYQRYGLDVRSLRYPGLIGHVAPPGGGTTDYAVDIYHHAVQGKNYTCFLREDTALPMMYMPDAIQATIDLMEASADKVSLHAGYNLSGMSFTPADITAAIQKHYLDFKVAYQPDFRQAIADSWSDSIDDSLARSDWGWEEKYDLEKMTADMLQQLAKRYSETVA